MRRGALARDEGVFFRVLAVGVRGQAFRNPFFAEMPLRGGKPLAPAKK